MPYVVHHGLGELVGAMSGFGAGWGAERKRVKELEDRLKAERAQRQHDAMMQMVTDLSVAGIGAARDIGLAKINRVAADTERKQNLADRLTFMNAQYDRRQDLEEYSARQTRRTERQRADARFVEQFGADRATIESVGRRDMRKSGMSEEEISAGDAFLRGQEVIANRRTARIAREKQEEQERASNLRIREAQAKADYEVQLAQMLAEQQRQKQIDEMVAAYDAGGMAFPPGDPIGKKVSEGQAEFDAIRADTGASPDEIAAHQQEWFQEKRRLIEIGGNRMRSTKPPTSVQELEAAGEIIRSPGTRTALIRGAKGWTAHENFYAPDPPEAKPMALDSESRGMMPGDVRFKPTNHGLGIITIDSEGNPKVSFQKGPDHSKIAMDVFKAMTTPVIDEKTGVETTPDFNFDQYVGQVQQIILGTELAAARAAEQIELQQTIKDGSEAEQELQNLVNTTGLPLQAIMQQSLPQAQAKIQELVQKADAGKKAMLRRAQPESSATSVTMQLGSVNGSSTSDRGRLIAEYDNLAATSKDILSKYHGGARLTTQEIDQLAAARKRMDEIDGKLGR